MFTTIATHVHRLKSYRCGFGLSQFRALFRRSHDEKTVYSLQRDVIKTLQEKHEVIVAKDQKIHEVIVAKDQALAQLVVAKDEALKMALKALNSQESLMRTSQLLSERSAQLLKYKGCLNMRGTIEYTEMNQVARFINERIILGEYEISTTTTDWNKLSRAEKWNWYLQHPSNNELRACLQQAALPRGRTGGDANLGQLISDTFKSLSEKIHGHHGRSNNQGDDKVVIYGDSERDKCVVTCLCEIFKYPFMTSMEEKKEDKNSSFMKKLEEVDTGDKNGNQG
ncbi:hypothetical protein CEUSTIGMA_g1794.t1 [Chlamydomonas eustigma]|uniref:Uncharacterized protein n=1 Tax=Chlamydomonas eustigma TaxID=1157962 RepID=A0A250WU66_9CHLO|nr:hypothetical protein CEUSTIGMA_g1794.t1 [Chlamydomonas eustigma]|eukprot:GAX74345.1 hypothetical protein CEUSTIGMA_g1794.t1 [Chlamydomonas eustigma]